MTSGETLRRNARRMICCLASLVLMGCDQIQQFFNGTPAPPPPAPVAQPAPPPPPPMAQPAPAVPNPGELVARFERLQMHERNDGEILALAAVPEAAAQIVELKLDTAAISDRGGAEFGKFPNLRKLSVQGTQITDKTISALAPLSQLEELNLHQCTITDASVPELLKLRRLKVLWLARTRISEVALAALGELPVLEEFNIAGCSSITGEGFTKGVKGGGYKSLKSLVCAGTSFASFGLERIKAVSQLEKLVLFDCGVNDVGLRWIAQCSQLKELQLNNNGFSDVGVAQVDNLKNLEILNIPGCKGVTDKSFNTLKNMKQLKELSVDGTSCTKNNAMQLKARFLKNTKIRVEGVEI